MSEPGNEQEEPETPDEWTALANTYTSVLVPSFAPIYEEVAEYVGADDTAAKLKVLDFGCGPGEPSLTMAKKFPNAEITGLDSTQPMLDIAAKVLAEHTSVSDRVSFHHVRRDVSMKDLVETAGNGFDWIVSSFVLHYVDFDRRVELVSQFLTMASKVLICAWGEQSKVGWLRAIKTYGTWKRDSSKDICEIELAPEDDGTLKTPRGSFTLCREEAYQGIADKLLDGVQMTFEIKSISVTFARTVDVIWGATRVLQSIWKLRTECTSDSETIHTLPTATTVTNTWARRRAARSTLWIPG